MAKVKFQGSAPGPAPKAVPYAQIDKQGRIPYGKSADVKVPMSLKRGTVRGMGAATKGGGYWEF